MTKSLVYPGTKFCTRARGVEILGYVERTLAHFQRSPVWKVS
jgi:hypothetical protein